MVTLQLFLLSISELASLLQVVSEKYSREFDSTSTALIFVSTGDLLYRLEASETYSVLTWVKFQVQPGTSLSFLRLETGGVPILTLSKETNGSLKAQAVTLSGLVITATLAGPVTPQWTHVVALVCSNSLTLAVTLWQGASASTVQTSAENFQAYNPASSSLVLGGTIGNMLVVRVT